MINDMEFRILFQRAFIESVLDSDDDIMLWDNLSSFTKGPILDVIKLIDSKISEGWVVERSGYGNFGLESQLDTGKYVRFRFKKFLFTEYFFIN